MPDPRKAKRIATGAIIPKRQLAAVSGESISLPDPKQLVHLQLRRFAGCPICSLHLRSVAKRHNDIAEAGVRRARCVPLDGGGVSWP